MQNVYDNPRFAQRNLYIILMLELIKLFSKASPGEKAKALEYLQRLDISNTTKYKEGLK